MHDSCTFIGSAKPSLSKVQLEKIVSMVDTVCAEKLKTHHQVTTEEVLEHREALTDNDTAQIDDVLQRLKKFSKIAQVAVALLHVGIADDCRSTTLLRASKFLLFATVREQMVSQMLKETNCRSEHFRLSINRAKARGADVSVSNTVFGQTHELLCEQNPRMFKTSKRLWSVIFLGEGAEDVGGPYREHLNEMCNELMSRKLGLFVPTANHVHNSGTHRDAYVPSPSATSPLHKSMFLFIGRLMGGAMRGGEPLNLFLPTLFWKQLAMEAVSEVDLESVDRMCLQCIREFREMARHGEAAKEMFEETFDSEVFTTQLSDGKVVPLIDNGENTFVTFERCTEYAEALARARLSESNQQVEWILKGLLSVVPESIITLLTPEELELRICGKADYTVQSLKESTTYEGLTSEDRRVLFLWQALEQSTPNQRRLFLKYVSGRERMPVKLRVLPMVTQGDPNMVLPRAATCFFALELPDYTTLEALQSKLYYAIENCMDIDTDFRARDVDDHEGPQLVVGLEEHRTDDADANANASSE
jgi:hypothetical protein